MTAAKRIFIVAGITLLALLQLAGEPANNTTACPAKFASYGFGYVKVVHLKTKKAFYLVDDQIHTHCCGDVSQYTHFINQISAAAREYIEGTLKDAPANYNLNPTFSKCLKSESEAEEIRSKKVKYFEVLGNKAYELSMNLTDKACN